MKSFVAEGTWFQAGFKRFLLLLALTTVAVCIFLRRTDTHARRTLQAASAGPATQPVRNMMSQTGFANTTRHGYPKLITYGDRCCTVAKSRCCNSGLKHGFKSCQAYGQADLASIQGLSPAGLQILQHRTRGAGYWVWKPLLIWQNLIEAEDGDVIMYMDAGAEIIADVSPLLQLTAHQDVVGFSLQHAEGTWTKRDTFVLLNAEELSGSLQMLASFIIVRRSWMSLGFVSQWLTYAQDSRAVTDDPSVLGAALEGFSDHRHDQSIFSLLYKRWNIHPYVDPSQYGNWNTSRPYPQLFNHHRERS